MQIAARDSRDAAAGQRVDAVREAAQAVSVVVVADFVSLIPIGQPGGLPKADRSSVLEIGQSKRRDAVAAVGGAEDREQGRVLAIESIGYLRPPCHQG